MFLIADQVMERQGGAVAAMGLMPQSGLLSVMFFVAAIALAGMPPLSGFIGKLLVMDAARDHDLVWWIWAVILIGSLVTIIGLARAGTLIFWKSHGLPDSDADKEADSEDVLAGEATAAPAAAPVLPLVVCFGLMGAIVLLTIFAGPMTRYADATAAQLFTPTAYIETVLGGGSK